MKKLFLLLFTTCHAFEIELGGGYQEGGLNWNIAGPSIDVLSELKWEDLKIWTTQGALTYYEEGYRFTLEGHYGKIFEGSVIDDDFGASGRTSCFSHLQARADKGEIYDYALAVGYPLTCGPIALTPYGGWGLDAQRLRIFDKSMPDLDSRYNATWKGPLAGGDFTYQCGALRLLAALEYHWLSYKGHAHWNLRTDLLGPFRHSGSGSGLKGKLGLSYIFAPCWSLGLLASLTHYRLRHGRERSRIQAFDGPLSLETPLNAVNWQSWMLTLSLSVNY